MMVLSLSQFSRTRITRPRSLRFSAARISTIRRLYNQGWTFDRLQTRFVCSRQALNTILPDRKRFRPGHQLDTHERRNGLKELKRLRYPVFLQAPLKPLLEAPVLQPRQQPRLPKLAGPVPLVEQVRLALQDLREKAQAHRSDPSVWTASLMFEATAEYQELLSLLQLAQTPEAPGAPEDWPLHALHLLEEEGYKKCHLDQEDWLYKIKQDKERVVSPEERRLSGNLRLRKETKRLASESASETEQRLQKPRAPSTKGTKLGDEAVRAIRQRYADGAKAKDLAAEYQVNVTTIERCVRGIKRQSHSQARVTEVQVRQIRDLYWNQEWTQAAIAAKFGLTQEGVSDIVNRRSWGHIE